MNEQEIPQIAKIKVGTVEYFPGEGNGYKDNTEALQQIIQQLDVIAGHLFVISERQERLEKNIDHYFGGK